MPNITARALIGKQTQHLRAQKAPFAEERKISFLQRNGIVNVNATSLHTWHLYGLAQSCIALWGSGSHCARQVIVFSHGEGRNLKHHGAMCYLSAALRAGNTLGKLSGEASLKSVFQHTQYCEMQTGKVLTQASGMWKKHKSSINPFLFFIFFPRLLRLLYNVFCSQIQTRSKQVRARRSEWWQGLETEQWGDTWKDLCSRKACK